MEGGNGAFKYIFKRAEGLLLHLVCRKHLCLAWVALDRCASQSHTQGNPLEFVLKMSADLKVSQVRVPVPLKLCTLD